jgi:hypothetical protein
MKKKLSARELEIGAAQAHPPARSAIATPLGEAISMLVRRGLKPAKSTQTLIPPQMEEKTAERFSEWLGHYAFRLFLRGAIQKSEGFHPGETTKYLTEDQSLRYAEVLVDLGLAEESSSGWYKLKFATRSFGGILEWYVGRELALRYGFDVATGVKLHIRGGGGDLDVVAAAEGKLVYLEMKSAPPKNLSIGEISAFWTRITLLRPDLSLFVVDTALRLTDKVIPMLLETSRSRGHNELQPKRIAAQTWALTPYIYAVNGSRDLMINIGNAIAAGLRARSPEC